MEIRENRFFSMQDTHKVTIVGTDGQPDKTVDVSFTLMLPYGVAWELCHKAVANFAQELLNLEENAQKNTEPAIPKEVSDVTQ